MNGSTVPMLAELREPGIAVLRLNRPARANAMDLDAIALLHERILTLSADRALRAVILTGAGPAFCAGLDLKSVLDEEGGLRLDGAGGYELQERFVAIVRELRRCDKVVIAAVNGPAVGFGFALTLAADIRLASPSASFHVGAVRIGLSAGECGISYHLPRLVGASRAFEVMLTGRPIDATEADRIGLVSRLVSGDELEAAALACARDVLRNSDFAIRQTKRLMWSNLDAPSLEAAIELENRTQVLGLQTGDSALAARAFAGRKESARGKG